MAVITNKHARKQSNKSLLTSWYGERDWTAVCGPCWVLSFTDEHTSIRLPCIINGEGGIVDISIAVATILSILGKAIPRHRPEDERYSRVSRDKAIQGHRGSDENGIGCLTDRHGGHIYKSEVMMEACHDDELSIAVL